MNDLHACEQDILAAILAEPNSYFELAGRVQPDMFADPVCRAIFHGIVTTFKEGAFSLSLVETNAVGAPDELDLLTRIHGLVAKGRTLGKIPLGDLAAPLFDRALTQKMLAENEKLTKALQTGSKPPAELLETAIDRLRELATINARKPTETLAEAGGRVYEKAKEARQGATPFGLSSGLTALDRELDGGLANGDLMILAGFPASGKTTLAMQIGEKAAQEGRSVFFAQAEMSAEQMAVRRLSALTQVPINRIRQGGCSPEEEEKIILWQQEWRDRKYEIQSGQFTIEDVHNVARAHKARHGLDLLVLDSAKRIGTRSRTARSPHEIASAVYEQAKGIAVDLDVPVIILGHPKDSVTQGAAPDYRLKMTDIYTGGNGEGIADTFLIVRRPEPRLNSLSGQGDSEQAVEIEVLLDRWRGRAEIFIDKNRNGNGQRRVDVQFDAARNVFTDVSALEDQMEVNW